MTTCLFCHTSKGDELDYYACEECAMFIKRISNSEVTKIEKGSDCCNRLVISDPSSSSPHTYVCSLCKAPQYG